MTKADIVSLVSHNTGLGEIETVATLEAIITTVKHSVKSGKKVTIRGFGTFERIYRKEKKGRNIAAGTQVIIPPRNVVKFIPSKHFKVEQTF
jgi:nucleoid DNA-binding protein